MADARIYEIDCPVVVRSPDGSARKSVITVFVKTTHDALATVIFSKALDELVREAGEHYRRQESWSLERGWIPK